MQFAHSGVTCARSVFVSAPDGVRLHVREHGDRRAPGLPVVCLPGLARTTQDFDALGDALANDRERPRRVLALDYRGRGLSDADAPKNYTTAVEHADALAVLTALDVPRAVFVGTSRGGILTMLLAAAQPTRVAGAVLNDIGPVIEPQGVMRIKSYLGRLPQPRHFDEGAEILKRLFASQFPKRTPEDWSAAARRTWREDKNGRLTLTYDPKLARTLDAITPERPPAKMWDQFDALARVPLLVIRGGLSDLLSAETVEEMRRRRNGDMDIIDVADEGHPPDLREPAIVGRIAAFVRGCESLSRHNRTS